MRYHFSNPNQVFLLLFLSLSLTFDSTTCIKETMQLRAIFVWIIIFYFKPSFQPYAFYSKRLQKLFIDQLARSKALCLFNRNYNKWKPSLSLKFNLTNFICPRCHSARASHYWPILFKYSSLHLHWLHVLSATLPMGRLLVQLDLSTNNRPLKIRLHLAIKIHNSFGFILGARALSDTLNYNGVNLLCW